MKETIFFSNFHNGIPSYFRQILLLFLVFSCVSVYSQSKTISDRDDYIKNMIGIHKENGQHLKKLIDDPQPSVYLDNGIVNVYGENPTALFTNPDSLINLSFASFNNKNIEIVTVRLSKSFDTYKPIDLSVFAAYPKLKYVYILSAVTNNPEQIIRTVKNIPAQINVFYKIDLGS